MDPVLITGAACSGLDVVAKALHDEGFWHGSNRPRVGGPYAGFLNTRILHLVSRPALRRGIKGGDERGQAYLPGPTYRSHLNDDKLKAHAMRETLFAIVEEQGHDGRPWFVHCAKAILVWPLWKNVLPESPWILVRNDREAVIRECLCRTYMNAYRTAAGWGEWYDAHLECFDEILRSGLDVHEFWIGRDDPGELARRFVRQYGMKRKEKR